MMYTHALIGANFATDPYDHQMLEFESHAESKARAKLWTMRTGKTKAAIDKACHLYRRGLIDGVLIFAPNGVHANWLEVEFPIHTWPGVTTAGITWRSSIAGAKGGNQLGKAARAAWAIEQEAFWKRLSQFRTNPALMLLAMNSESMTRPDCRRVVSRFLKHRRVYVIFDESDDFGTPGSKRTKWARALAKRCPYREIDSGTAIDTSPLQAWSQFELLEHGALGFDTYALFKDRYAVVEKQRGKGGRSYPKVTGYQNTDELRERMAKWGSVVLRDECNMPRLIENVEPIVPTPEMREAYNALVDDFVIDLDAGRVNVGERAPRFQKLQQVFSGFLIDEAKRVHIIPGGNPRLDMIARDVYRAPGKVIVWCNFQKDMDLVEARLRAEGHEVATYHGRTKDKPAELARFKTDPKCKALIAHAKSGGRGIDLSVASRIIWYSHTFSARLRRQAMDRASKLGGRNIRVTDYEAPGPDKYIRKVIDSRIDIADSIAGAGLRDLLRSMRL